MTWLAKDEGYVQTEEAEDSVDGKDRLKTRLVVWYCDFFLDTNRVAIESVFGGCGG